MLTQAGEAASPPSATNHSTQLVGQGTGAHWPREDSHPAWRRRYRRSYCAGPWDHIFAQGLNSQTRAGYVALFDQDARARVLPTSVACGALGPQDFHGVRSILAVNSISRSYKEAQAIKSAYRLGCSACWTSRDAADTTQAPSTGTRTQISRRADRGHRSWMWFLTRPIMREMAQSQEF